MASCDLPSPASPQASAPPSFLSPPAPLPQLWILNSPASRPESQARIPGSLWGGLSFTLTSDSLFFSVSFFPTCGSSLSPASLTFPTDRTW